MANTEEEFIEIDGSYGERVGRLRTPLKKGGEGKGVPNPDSEIVIASRRRGDLGLRREIARTFSRF